MEQGAVVAAGAYQQGAYQQGGPPTGFAPPPTAAGGAPPYPGMAGPGPGPAGMGYPSQGSTVFDMPNVPQNAWPSYAAYPNYAAVTYPTEYSASAWPYIGPFYPYPQVPLGWRQVQLEWDDGFWNLNFRPRTDRWWWFLDPQKW
jgi:hypothetical protein